MIRNYLKIAWRNIVKGKVSSLINISGLAIGLACAIAIGLFITDEYSYDRFHQNADNIYRVVQHEEEAGEIYDVASSAGPMGAALKADFPEVIKSCLLGYKRSGVLQHGKAIVESSDITMADTGFLKMFDFKLLIGNINNVFTVPDQVVVTEKMAINLFGRNWAANNALLGSTILYKRAEGEHIEESTLTIAGVVQNPPANSHLQFDVMLTYNPALQDNQNWASENYLTYIQLKDGTDPATFNKKLVGYIDKYRAENKDVPASAFFLQPLTDIYLHSDFDFQTDWTKTSSVIFVNIFFAVGVIVLMIAVFNFINLSTARATRRAKEVGIRKTIGAYRRQLIIQFLSESLLTTIISVCLAFLIIVFSLPLLNDIASKSLQLPINNAGFIGVVMVFIILVSLLAGIYPAMFLSGFQPIKVLKGVFDIHSGRRFRQILVVTQFAFTVLLVASAIVIYKQLDFLHNKKLGFDKSQLVYLDTKSLDRSKALLLRQDLQRHSSIAEASLTSNNLIDLINSTTGFEWEGKVPEDKFIITRLNVDPYYLRTTGMKLIAGHNFDESTTPGYIINRTAVKRMGWTPEKALGKSFTIWGKTGRVIGVVDNFHYRPMTSVIDPLVLMYRPERYYAGIMIKTIQGKSALKAIEDLYKKYEPTMPAHYGFVDRQLDDQYKLEQRSAEIVFIFSGLAIFVACLGLYGLVVFTAEKRRKEIGIRKVMGASIANLSGLLSMDFIWLVVVSIIIASPIGYYLLHSWLQKFSYRIALEWYYFAEAGLLALLIAAITVLCQSFIAARINLIKILRVE